MRTTEALDRDWRANYEHSAVGMRCLRRWAGLEPALCGLVDLGDVLQARRDRHRSTEVLAALARLAPADTTAARTLLQALLPGIVDVALRQFRHDCDALEELVSLAWERIRTYPSQRRGNVAGNVLMDVRKRYVTAHARSTSHEVPVAEPNCLGRVPSAEHAVLVAMALREFGCSVQTGLINSRAYDLIVRTRLGDDSLADVAGDLGTTIPSAECIRWRAERKLRSRLDPAA